MGARRDEAIIVCASDAKRLTARRFPCNDPKILLDRAHLSHRGRRSVMVHVASRRREQVRINLERLTLSAPSNAAPSRSLRFPDRFPAG